MIPAALFLALFFLGVCGTVVCWLANFCGPLPDELALRLTATFVSLSVLGCAAYALAVAL